MNTWTLLFDTTDRENFKKIESGEKTIETRALDDPKHEKSYYSKISAGDTIILQCGEDEITKQVKEIRKYCNFEDFLTTENLEAIMGEGTTPETAKEKYYSFPCYKERLEKFGINVIEF